LERQHPQVDPNDMPLTEDQFRQLYREFMVLLMQHDLSDDLSDDLPDVMVVVDAALTSKNYDKSDEDLVTVKAALADRAHLDLRKLMSIHP
jgi:hypothetical protein